VSGDIDDFRGLLAKVGNGETLGIDEAERAIDIMTAGDATPAQMGAFLMGLKVRGETAEELAGGSRALRAKVLRVKAPEGTIDIVGTGGDHHGTYNVSSCSAFVVAGAGIPVAKHGNRAFTSKSGAADVLSALGIGLEVPIEKLEKALAEAKVCFLMAPRHHSAMRNVAGPRVELAPSRTIFNLLGPMSNPALVRRQLVGVFDRRWLKPVAQALGQLGLERALVVHGQDGMDELTTTTASWAASLENGKVTEIEITPEEIGVKRATLDELKGGDAAHNAEAIHAVLGGEKNAFRDIVLLNSAAALMVAEAHLVAGEYQPTLDLIARYTSDYPEWPSQFAPVLAGLQSVALSGLGRADEARLCHREDREGQGRVADGDGARLASRLSRARGCGAGRRRDHVEGDLSCSSRFPNPRSRRIPGSIAP